MTDWRSRAVLHRGDYRETLALCDGAADRKAIGLVPLSQPVRIKVGRLHRHTVARGVA